MNLYSAIVAIVALWAIVQITRYWLHARSQAENGARASTDDAELKRLEERVRNLERIVTDDREILKRKFDNLE
ncbi:MAG: hypothetical protein ACNA7E_05925 [Wenzhouxiangellaceae bacterium]